MAQFKFDWSQEQTYPYVSVNGVTLTAQPGEVYDLDEAPDEKFTPLTPAPAPEATTAPAEGEA